MKKKEVQVVQAEANKKIAIFAIIAGILLFVFVAWIIKTQFIQVLENGCSAYGEGYEETYTEHKDSLTGKTYVEYKCCKKGNVSCITVSMPKKE